MNAFCYKFISDSGRAKFIKIGQDLPKLLTKVCCHVFYAPHVLNETSIARPFCDR